MVDPSHYVPILLTRMGERTALAHLPASTRKALTPLMAVPPVDWDYDNDAPAKSLTAHLAKSPVELHKALGNREAFVDLLLLDDDGPLDDGNHPLAWLTGETAKLGLYLIPTVSPSRSDSYRSAAAAVVARDGRGACIRLQIGEWPSDLTTELHDLLAELSLTAGQVDLMLDLGEETGPLAPTALRSELDMLPSIDEWRSLIVAGSGLPKTMPSGQGLHVLPRTDWLVYRDVISGSPAPSRIPTFADYVITNPDPVVDVDPKMMSISGTFRYTAEDDWLFSRGLLWKGRGGSGVGAAAMVPAAAQLRAHPLYTADHCDGEDWIDQVATNMAGGGAPMVWRRYGTSHHLQRVTDQVATLHASLGAP